MPTTAAQPPFVRAHEENLTRDEAGARSSAISVSSYDVHVDLSRAAETNATTYPVETRLEFSFTPASGDQNSTFLDYIGASVHSLTVNGRGLEPSANVGSARILLSDLNPGINVVDIKSTSRFSRSGEGMHRFVDPADGEVYLYTQYEPADCRRVFPVFEQPDLKARFTFTITGPASWQLRSNGTEVSRDHVEGEAAGLTDVGLVRVKFHETELMSSYITALLAGPYHVVEDSWVGGPPDAEPSTIDMALLCRRSLAVHFDADELFRITKQGLHFFHEQFAYRYPWGKYDQVFVPEYNLGAMENPGLVTFTEEYVFDTAATEAQHENRANTLLHEMAHMWFGDLVTMRWWDDLWLKESFADYMGALAVDSASDFTTGWISFANSRKGWAYVQDQLPTTHPIVADISDLEAADQNFDGITYAKGASVLKQLAAFAGQEAFVTSTQRYFHRHAFGNASLADFLNVLEEVTGKDMQAWAEAWLQTAGLPVLSTEIDDAGTVSLLQSGTDPTTGHTVARPHVTRVGLFTLDGSGALARAQSLPLEIRTGAPTERHEVPGIGLPEAGVPRLILTNDDDLTYAKLSLDPESVAAALCWPIADPLARATVWANLWSMARDGELPAARFVDAVSTLGLQIPEVSVAATVLRQADAACEHFAPAAQRAELEGKLAARLAGFIAESEGGDLQRAAARRLALLSRRHPGQLNLISELLTGTEADHGVSGLEVDEELRWAFLQALAAHGLVDTPELDAELNSRTTARGKIAHRLAVAARPLATSKHSASEQALVGADEYGAELSNDHLTATVEGYTVDPQRLTAGYEQDYFAALPQVWERMTQGQATRVVEGLFPGAQSMEPGQMPEKHPIYVMAGEWLATHRDAPAALRRIIIEQQDHLVRALRAQVAAAVEVA